MMKEPIKFQTILSQGKPAFVVIPYDEFLRLMPQEKKALDSCTIPHAVIKASIKKNISKIRAWREYLGLSQKEIASKLDISQAALSQMEVVNAKLRKVTLLKIASSMNLSYEQIR